jgi:type 1 glutamine amidotransferase
MSRKTYKTGTPRPTLRLALASLALSYASTAAAAPLTIGYLFGSQEYAAEASLKAFAPDMESKHGARSIHFRCRDQAEGSSQSNPTRIDNIASLDSVDVLVIYSRRCWVADDQFPRLKSFLESGKGLVGLRTASHAFQNWDGGRGIDTAVWGGAYNNHGGASGYALEVTTAGQAHPILSGVGAWRPSRTLYFQNLPGRSLASDAVVLMHGSNGDGRHPVAWARTLRGGRVFYTSTGVQEDFQNAAFRTLLTNALLWAGGQGSSGISIPRSEARRPWLPRLIGVQRFGDRDALGRL